jgi:glycosyltransferase involved in cell wall biosynthesis
MTAPRRSTLRHDERTDVTYVGLLLGHGGDAIQMLELASGLKRTGASVRVIVPQSPSSETFQSRCYSVGVECERSPLITADMSGARQNIIAILKLLRSIRSPIVHFHSGNSCLPRSVMGAQELLRFRPSVATIHSPYQTIDPGSARAKLWATSARRRLHAVVSPSHHGSSFQLRCGLPNEIVTTVPSSIDVDAFANGDPSGPRAAIGAGPDDEIVLFSSRLDPQKRPVDAMRAFAAIADEFPRALLVMLGQGSESHIVVDTAAALGITHRLRCVGSQANVRDWLAAATVWILPTERENFSVALLEALAAGCAVMSTPCPGNNEVLVDGVNALTFDVGDVEAAAGVLRTLLGDPALRRRLRVAAQESVRTYSVAGMVESYRRIYEGVGGGRGGQPATGLAPEPARTELWET